MNAQIIEEEINQLKSQLSFLENQLREIQASCTHQFEGNHLFETCVKCKKVNSLYY